MIKARWRLAKTGVPDPMLHLFASKHGTDDLLAGCLLSLSDGISAYTVRDNNQHGNIVDGLIAGLQRYREEMIACGKIR